MMTNDSFKFNIIIDRSIGALDHVKYIVDCINSIYISYLRGKVNELSKILPQLVKALV